MLGMNMLPGCPACPAKRCGHSVDGMAAAGGFVDICSCGAVLNTKFGRE